MACGDFRWPSSRRLISMQKILQLFVYEVDCCFHFNLWAIQWRYGRREDALLMSVFLPSNLDVDRLINSPMCCYEASFLDTYRMHDTQ